jgi:hypothetical protein
MTMDSRNCHDFEPWIDLFVGGDLEPAEARALSEHLAACPTCKQRVDLARCSLERVRSLAPATLAEELPRAGEPGFWDEMTEAVLERVSRLPARRSAAGKLLWFGAGFVAAASLLLLVWLTGAMPSSPLAPAWNPADQGLGGVAQTPGRGNLVPVTGPIERWAALPIEDGFANREEEVVWPEVPLEVLHRAFPSRFHSPVVPAGGQANF